MALLSINESTRELGLSRESVERLIRRGSLPSVRIGRRILVERAELDSFIASRRQPGKRAVETTQAEAVI